MNDDKAEEICEEIVETLNAAQLEDPNPFEPIIFVASKPADPLAELQLEHPTIQVFLIPYAETKEKIGRPRYRETIQISLWVIRKIDLEWTRERMSSVVSTISDYLRGTKMACYTPGAPETATKFDLTQLHKKKQFLSIVRLNYTGIR